MELYHQSGTYTARFAARLLIYGENDGSSTLIRCGLYSTNEVAEKRNKYLLLLETEPQTSSLQLSHYSD